jgi:hypothetical protein
MHTLKKHDVYMQHRGLEGDKIQVAKIGQVFLNTQLTHYSKGYGA